MHNSRLPQIWAFAKLRWIGAFSQHSQLFCERCSSLNVLFSESLRVSAFAPSTTPSGGENRWWCSKLCAFDGKSSFSSFLPRWWTFDSRQLCYQTDANSKSLKRFLIALITIPSSRRSKTRRTLSAAKWFMSCCLEDNWWSESASGSPNPRWLRIWNLSSLWRESTRSHSVRVSHAVFQAHIESLLFHTQIKVSRTSTQLFHPQVRRGFALLACGSVHKNSTWKNMVPRGEKPQTHNRTTFTHRSSFHKHFSGLSSPARPSHRTKAENFDGGWNERRKIQTEIEFLSMYTRKAYFPAVETEFRRNEDSCENKLTVLVLLLAPADDGTARSGGELLHIGGRQAHGQQMIVESDTSCQLRRERECGWWIEEIKFSKRVHERTWKSAMSLSWATASL